MSMNFLALQDEVKRRGIRNQGGTQFDQATKNLINTSIQRISREAPWRVLRRLASLNTETSYSTGTGAVTVTASSTSFSVVGATFITNNIRIGRRIKFGTSGTYYTIATITSETAGTIDQSYDGTTSTTTSYEILPTEEYNLPIRSSWRSWIWHRAYGYPYKLYYVTDQDFRFFGIDDTNVGVPMAYRMWGVDDAIEQPTSGSVMRIASSLAADTNVKVTIFGTVSSYPDFETITTNASDGTTAVSGTKTFTRVDRIIKATTTVGRITVDSNSAAVTVATIPVGLMTQEVKYNKIQLYPLPDAIYPIYVQYYEEPYALVTDQDVHALGNDFDECIILLATSKLKAEQNETEADKFFALFTDEMRTLRRTNMDKPDFFETLKRPNYSRKGFFGRYLMWNQLGGNYGPMVGR